MKQFFQKVYACFLKFAAKLDTIGKDKYMHFIAGSAITACAAFVPVLMPYGWVLGFSVGILNECIGKAHGGEWDSMNFTVTALGALICQIFLFIYMLIW